MSALLASLYLAASPVAQPPAGLQFGFWRMASFKSRAAEMRCKAKDLDRELEQVRADLAKRYGAKAFAWPKIPKGQGPKGGDCYSIVMVYRTNLADFKREAAAVLNQAEGSGQ